MNKPDDALQCVGKGHSDGGQCERDAYDTGRFCEQHAAITRPYYVRYKTLTHYAQTAFLSIESNHVHVLKGIYAVVTRALHLRRQFADKFVHVACRDAGHLVFESHLDTLSQQVEQKLVAVFQSAAAAATTTPEQKHEEAEEPPSEEAPGETKTNKKNKLRRGRNKLRKQTDQFLLGCLSDTYSRYYSLRMEATQLYSRVYFQVMHWAETCAPELVQPLYANASFVKGQPPLEDLRAAVLAGSNELYEPDESPPPLLHQHWESLMDVRLPGRPALHSTVRFWMKAFLNNKEKDPAAATGYSAADRHELIGYACEGLSTEESAHVQQGMYQWLSSGGDPMRIQLLVIRYQYHLPFLACATLSGHDYDSTPLVLPGASSVNVDDEQCFYSWFIDFAETMDEVFQSIAQKRQPESHESRGLRRLMQPDAYRSMKASLDHVGSAAYAKEMGKNLGKGLCACGCKEIQPSKRRFTNHQPI